MNTHIQKVALITGAARGFGQAISLGLAERGAKIVAVDLNDPCETVDAIYEKGGEAIGLQGDISSPEEVAKIGEKALKHYGRIDILINNAGIFPYKEIIEMSFEEWKKVMSINLDSMFLLTKTVLPGMKENRWGRIVNIASSSVITPIPGMSHYMASKMGAIGFTRGLANDLGDYGITVNAIAPSLTSTPGGAVLAKKVPFESVAELQSIKKVAEAKDIVGPVLFLTSQESYFITGQTIAADGGLAKFGG